MPDCKIFATYGSTESGDDLPVLLWKEEPSKDAVNDVYRSILPEEYDEVGFVCWKVMEASYVG